MTDEELKATYVDSNRGSFSALLEHWAPLLHGFFPRTPDEPATVDDLLQLTFRPASRSPESSAPASCERAPPERPRRSAT